MNTSLSLAYKVTDTDIFFEFINRSGKKLCMPLVCKYFKSKKDFTFIIWPFLVKQDIEQEKWSGAMVPGGEELK